MNFRFFEKSALVFVLLLWTSGAAWAGQAYVAGWTLNFTPALVSQGNDYGLGGGIDPELRYDLGFDEIYMSLGTRIGAYYAKKLFSVLEMPTARLTLPIGSFDPYAAIGAGYGWIPKLDEAHVARMYRGGFIYHFNNKLGLGIEGTYQEILHTDFHFFSLGSMVSFEL